MMESPGDHAWPLQALAPHLYTRLRQNRILNVQQLPLFSITSLLCRWASIQSGFGSTYGGYAWNQ